MSEPLNCNSQLYKGIQMTTSEHTLGVKGKWELVITVVVEDGSWERIALVAQCGRSLKMRYFRTFLISKLETGHRNVLATFS